MVGKPSLFCEGLGRQIHDPFFACHFMRAVLRAQNWFRGEQFVKNNVSVNPFRKAFRTSEQDSQEETEYREKCYSKLHKSSATSKSCVTCGAGHETDIYCAINTNGLRMAMDLLRNTAWDRR